VTTPTLSPVPLRASASVSGRSGVPARLNRAGWIDITPSVAAATDTAAATRPGHTDCSLAPGAAMLRPRLGSRARSRLRHRRFGATNAAPAPVRGASSGAVWPRLQEVWHLRDVERWRPLTWVEALESEPVGNRGAPTDVGSVPYRCQYPGRADSRSSTDGPEPGADGLFERCRQFADTVNHHFPRNRRSTCSGAGPESLVGLGSSHVPKALSRSAAVAGFTMVSRWT
jgi:hypothetical protein